MQACSVVLKPNSEMPDDSLGIRLLFDDFGDLRAPEGRRHCSGGVLGLCSWGGDPNTERSPALVGRGTPPTGMATPI